MNDIILEGGVIVYDSINRSGCQDYIEVVTGDGRRILISASVNGRFKVGLKLKDDGNNKQLFDV